MNHTTRAVVATALTAAIAAPFTLGSASATPADVPLAAVAEPAPSPDPVILWNGYASDALMVTAGQPPQQSVPHLAMVQGAVYDAVNAIDAGHQPYLLTSRVATPEDSIDAAVAAAAHGVLVHLVPSQQPTLDTRLDEALAAVPAGPARSRGIDVGKAAAQAMIEARTHDGRFGPFRFGTGTGVGVWRPVPPSNANDPNAWLKDVRPFVVPDVSRFEASAPPPITSRRYARDFHEVRTLGSATSTVRTADQTASAKYWAENPPATWARILRTIATQEDVSTVDTARLFASAWMNAADSLITVWTGKARWLFWRPLSAITEADTDGNRWTHADPDWTPLIPTPPYPEHPSGHTGLSGAMVATMQHFYGTDRIAWTDTNNAGLTRGFTRLSHAIDDVVNARVWSGIHFRTADEDGADIARRIVRWQASHHFRPVHRTTPAR